MTAPRRRRAAGIAGSALHAREAGPAPAAGSLAGCWVLAALVLLAVLSPARSHKNYPETTAVRKAISAQATPEEIEEQMNNFDLSPSVPNRYMVFSLMLATNGLGDQYPKGAEGRSGYEGGHSANPMQVATTLNWFQVVTGGFHTCAIRRYFNRSKHTAAAFNDFVHTNPDDAPGQLRCWGMNDYGQVHPMPMPLGEPPTADTTDAYGNLGPACTAASEQPKVIGRTNVNAGLPGDAVEVTRRDCWDWDDGWRNISAGWLHTCGILADGRMFCWGNNEHGELGDSARPGLLKEGQPQCAGANGTDGAQYPCQSEFSGKYALTDFGGVAAGKRQTCAIKCVDDQAAAYTDPYSVENERKLWPSFPPATCTQGRVLCWGDNRLGQGAGGLTAKNLQEYNDFVSVCAAAAHSCAVRDEGSLYCWGHDGNKRTQIPQQLVNERWRAVRCRGAHTCALTVMDQLNRSALYCWGHNGHKQSIVPAFAKQVLVPVEGSQVPTILREIYTRAVRTFDAGDSHTCALWETTADERSCRLSQLKPPAMNGECWGDNSYGQSNLDLNFRPYGWQPGDICEALYYREMSTGSYHTCAITTDDVGIFCKKDSKCDEYPDPLCEPNCYDGNEPFRGKGATMSPCPRHIKGAVTETPTRGYKDAAETQPDTNLPYCVPARTNHLRCWGLDSHEQQFVPGLWVIQAGGYRLSALTLPCMAISIVSALGML